MLRTIIIAGSALCLSAAAALAGEPGPQKYEPLPKWSGYMDPKEIADLEDAVAKGDEKTVRDHGWKLWAGIMQPTGVIKDEWPLWYTWTNTHFAFLPSGGIRPAQAEAVDAAPQPEALSLIQRNKANAGQTAELGRRPPVNVARTPQYPIPAEVCKNFAPAANCDTGNIADGAHFLFNGDIMIPTESLSPEAFQWIRDDKLYEQTTLNSLVQQKVHQLDAPQRHIVTKHMYWPVKAGSLGVLPVWHDDKPPTFSGYAGYETWQNFVAIDPDNARRGSANVTYLYGVKNFDGSALGPISGTAMVHPISEFYFHKITAEDWASFDQADQAILNASSYWAYNQPFGVGDYLVTVAMHVNTKEIPTWALQSVWWSDQADQGKYAQDRPDLSDAQGPWRHYLMTDSYGIPNGPNGEQPVSMNPYIELVIHPVATNCNNCHVRAGWPKRQASYQNKGCDNLLATLTADAKCLKDLTLTDFQWIIPDRAIGLMGAKKLH